MKLALLTITWKRPRLLGRLIECFNRQTHDDREMIIVEDAGQYPDQPSGDRWRIVSFDRRFCSLGSKRNCCAALASADCDGFVICDDDDFLFPWGMAACSRALERGVWAQPREVFEWDRRGRLVRQETFSRQRPNYVDYHSGWCYRRATFEAMRGYPIAGEEDNPVRDELVVKHGPAVNTICAEFPHPFIIYGGDSSAYRISHLYQKHRGDDMYAAAWRESGRADSEGEFVIGWDRDYCKLDLPSKASPALYHY